MPDCLRHAEYLVLVATLLLCGCSEGAQVLPAGADVQPNAHVQPGTDAQAHAPVMDARIAPSVDAQADADVVDDHMAPGADVQAHADVIDASVAPSADAQADADVEGTLSPLVSTPKVIDPVSDPAAPYRDPWHEKLVEAQVVEKSVRIGAVTLRYAEGPANGPALLLLHAQHMDWYAYSRVMPELSKSFHVFAVSYHGHGLSQSPIDRLKAEHIGADLTVFIERVIGEPVLLSGNSSGALLSVWLAANSPSWVRAVLLEDPPLFTAELPRAKETVAYRTFTTCHEFLQQSDSDDFLLYWLNSNREFVTKQVGEAGFALVETGIRTYRLAHPGERVELNWLPDTMRLLIRGLDVYDPHFGDAFYDGHWNEGFDHATALQRVAAPTLLLHANFHYLEDGTLYGALDDDDAARAMSLLKNGKYLRVDADHVVTLDKPSEFIGIVEGFFSGL